MSSKDIVSKRARVEEAEETERSDSEGQKEFVPLRENLFEDAVFRWARPDAGPSVSSMMLDTGDLHAAYTSYFKGQTGSSVPADIVSEYLVPYLRHNRLIVLAFSVSRKQFAGFYIGVGETGEPVVVTGVDPEMAAPENLPDWPQVAHDPETMTRMESVYGSGYLFRFSETAETTDLERRFWILVFNRVFRCDWWHFQGLKFVM